MTEKNVQIVGRLKSPIDQKFHDIVSQEDGKCFRPDGVQIGMLPGGEFVEKGVEIRIIPDEPVGMQFIAADGGGIETAPSVTVGETLGADFVGDHEYVSVPLAKTKPEPGDLLSLEGVPENLAILGRESVMVSRGFNVSWFEFASLASERASLINRLATLVNRACFKFELHRPDKLSTLVDKIIKKHPEISDKLILDCFEVANPDMLTASNERLVHMWGNWQELVAIIDARPLPENEG